MSNLLKIMLYLGCLVTLGGGYLPNPSEVQGDLDSLNMRVVSRYPHGPVHDIVVSQDFLYLTSGGGFFVLDVSDPYNPITFGGGKIWHFPLDGMSWRVAVKEPYLYIADVYYNQLSIVEILNKGSYALVTHYSLPGTPLALEVKDTLIYIACGTEGLRIINVKNPSSPQEIGHIAAAGSIENFFIQNNYAYLADPFARVLRIVDISNPSSLAEIVTYNTGSNGPNAVYVQDSLAYLTLGNSGLKIINVKNTSSIQEVGSYTPLGGDAYGIKVKDTLAFVLDIGLSILRMIDIKNPSNPQEVGNFNIEDGGTNGAVGTEIDVEVNDSILYLVGWPYYLGILDISDPQNPAEINSFWGEGEANDVTVQGEWAYLANGGAMVWGINISDLASPMRGAGFNSEEDAKEVFIKDSLMYVADNDELESEENALVIVDISEVDSHRMTEIGSYHAFGDVSGVFVRDSIAYMAWGEAGLRIINVSDPTSPYEISNLSLPGEAQGIYLQDNLAYLACGEGGLQIVDIENSTTPLLKGSYVTPGEAHKVFVLDSLAYVAWDSAGLVIVNVADPANPQLVSTYYTAGDEAYDVAGSWPYIFVVGDEFTMVINVRDPSSPYRAGFYSTGQGRGLDWQDPYLYVADEWRGLFVFEFTGEEETPDIYSEESHDFGENRVGEKSDWNLSILNIGSGKLQIDSLALNDSAFSISTSPDYPILGLEPGDAVEFTVSFSPQDTLIYQGILNIYSNDPDEGKLEISLRGEGTPIPLPDVEVSASSYDFGSILVGDTATWSVFVYNRGDTTLILDSVITTNSVFLSTLPETKNVQDSVAMTVKFIPSDIGSYEGKIIVYSNDSDESSVEITVAGDGTMLLLPQIVIDTSFYNFGKVSIGNSKDQVFRVINIGTDTLKLDSMLIDHPVFKLKNVSLPQTLVAQDTLPFTITFSPQETISYRDTLQIFNNDPDSSVLLVILEGEGSVPPGIYIFPNPYIPSRGHTELAFANVPAGGEVKIFSLAGDLLYKTKATTESVVKWDGKTKRDKVVGTGIYLLVVTDKDGKVVKREKFAVVR